jgi:hypothetical protein
MWHLPAKEEIPSIASGSLSGQNPDWVPLRFAAKNRAQAPGWAYSGEHYQPRGSGLSLGVGVLLVFSSLAEMYSLTITMPTDQRQREVLSAAGCAVTLSTFLVGWPQGELGWERVLWQMAVWVWAHAGWHSKSKVSVLSFWVVPVSLTEKKWRDWEWYWIGRWGNL